MSNNNFQKNNSVQNNNTVFENVNYPVDKKSNVKPEFRSSSINPTFSP